MRRLFLQYIVCVALLSAVLPVAAQRPAIRTSRPNHYLALSMQGGAALTLTDAEAVKIQSKTGGQAAVGLHYELRSRNFFLSLGAQLDWLQTAQAIDAGWSEGYLRSGYKGEAFTYNYRYSEFRETQRNVQVAPMLMLGGYLGKYVYLSGGVKLRLTMSNTYSSRFALTTDGVWSMFIHPIQNSTDYGFYPSAHYTSSGKDFQMLNQPVVAPVLEVGAKLPISTPSHRFGMRVGAYVEYGVPLRWEAMPTAYYNPEAAMVGVPTLADYRKVRVLYSYQGVPTPQTVMTQQNLHDHLHLNTLMNSEWLKRGAQNLEVGIKLTMLFNVTTPQHMCNCETPLSVGVYRNGALFSND